MLSSNSQRETLIVMPIVSCDPIIATLTFTRKAVMTWKHCSCSPQAFLQHEFYKNMRSNATEGFPMLSSEIRRDTPTVMPIVSCDTQITTLPFTQKAIKT